MPAADHDAALSALHRRYGPELEAYARRLLGGDHAQAEDVVQEAFIRTHRRLRARPERPLHARPWLYRLVRNGALDELRSARHRNVKLGEPLPDRDGGDALGVLVDRATARETLGRVAALPPRQREALVLHAVHGLSHERVAQVLLTTPQASRVLVHRARQGL